MWFQPWKGSVRAIGEGSVRGPAGDPDGTTAVWFDGTELVMYDTVAGEELARATPPEPAGGPWEDEYTMPSPQAENAHGNLIVDVTAEEVTWLAPAGRYHFDRPSARISLTSMESYDLDIHEGRLAIQDE